MRKSTLLLATVPFAILAGLIIILTRGHSVPVLQAHGTIAAQERNLLAFAFFLSMIVIIPVFILAIVIASKYRADKPKGEYHPDWNSNRKLELTWWGIPCAIILILSVVTWVSSHHLDPAQPIASTVQPLNIQAVALDWKWLFIYPDQNIATVNYLKVPVGVPLHFSITADAPMNSLWIPQLGGQIYAMPGMSTQLNLRADKPGTYYGSSANISGEGFASMKFNTDAIPLSDFNTWVQQSKLSSTTLSSATYATLAQPSHTTIPATFASVEHNLYGTIVMKYMLPDSSAVAQNRGNDTTGTNAPETAAQARDMMKMNMQQSGMGSMEGME